jgi:hypothetical protein
MLELGEDLFDRVQVDADQLAGKFWNQNPGR